MLPIRIVSVALISAVSFVMLVSSLCAYAIHAALAAIGAPYLQLVAFIVVIAATVQLVEMLIRKLSPALFRALGIYLPLITTNCAVLAAATEVAKPGFFKMAIEYNYSFGEGLIYTLGVAAGYGFALLSFTALRERLDIAPVPSALKGNAMSFIAAGLLSLAYVGLAGWFGL